MRESAYQRKVIEKVKKLLPGCMILKNDPTYIQGIPDILVLHGQRWGMLEFKIDEKADVQPNQAYYVEKLGNMSFAAFIHPGNEQAVLDELQLALGT